MTGYFTITSKTEMRPSPTMSAASMAKDAEARGKKVDLVTIGDLFPKPSQDETARWLNRLKQDAANPENAKQEMYATLRTGEKIYAYSETTGLPSLRAAAAHTFSRDTGCAVTKDEVMIGVGGKGALNGVFFNTVKAGEVVLMAVPGWPSNFDMFPPGVTLVEIPTKDGILRATDLAAVLKVYPNPKMVLINAPSNPTGSNYTPEEREAFFAAITSTTKDTIVASDDPYGKLVFDREPYDIAAVLQRGPVEKKLFAEGRVAVFRTVSKEYGLAGERVGFVATKHKDMLRSLQLWNENKGGGMGVENQILAEAALLYGDGFIVSAVDLLKEKGKMLTEGVAKMKTAHMEDPRGTIYGWVNFVGLKGKQVPAGISESSEAYTITTPADMMRYLVNVVGVCPVPGVPFYAPGSPAGKDDWHARVTFCGPLEQLTRVIANLQSYETKLTESSTGSSRQAG